MGVLWNHSSVNLVGPRSIAPAGPGILQRMPESDKRLAPPSPRRNRRGGNKQWREASQFRINHSGMILAFGFNDLAEGGG
jgi:hypothetical protein